jgi:alpha-tubulin suppressor-like RCC1 family protein
MVNDLGAISGLTFTAVAVGCQHSVALSSGGKSVIFDHYIHSLGLVYTWGFNLRGQIGDGSTTDRSTPVAVPTSGALSNKIIVAIAASCGATFVRHYIANLTCVAGISFRW